MKLARRFFEPTWAGGWAFTRVLFGLVTLAAHGPRARGIGDAWAVQDMVFSTYPFRFTEHWILTEQTAWILWGAGVLGSLLVIWGGKAAKPGVLLFLAASWMLLAEEALNIKAYDRLITWVSLGMLLGPIGERKLTTKERSPVGRYYLIILYIALYGSTGWHKAILETKGWLDGSVLSYHLVHYWFGMKPIGVWASTQQWITAPGSWLTLFFECGFPLLIWWRRATPWLLLAGFLMHMGILFLMNVGPFSYVAVAAYPVLLHPEEARRIYAERVLPLWNRLRKGEQRDASPTAASNSSAVS